MSTTWKIRITMLREPHKYVGGSPGGSRPNEPAVYWHTQTFDDGETARAALQEAIETVDWLIVNDGYTIVPSDKVARIDIVEVEVDEPDTDISQTVRDVDAEIQARQAQAARDVEYRQAATLSSLDVRDGQAPPVVRPARER